MSSRGAIRAVYLETLREAANAPGRPVRRRPRNLDDIERHWAEREQVAQKVKQPRRWRRK